MPAADVDVDACTLPSPAPPSRAQLCNLHRRLLRLRAAAPRLSTFLLPRPGPEHLRVLTPSLPPSPLCTDRPRTHALPPALPLPRTQPPHQAPPAHPHLSSPSPALPPRSRLALAPTPAPARGRPGTARDALRCARGLWRGRCSGGERACVPGAATCGAGEGAPAEGDVEDLYCCWRRWSGEGGDWGDVDAEDPRGVGAGALIVEMLASCFFPP